MIREQRIIERIVNEIGDELNEYINSFNGCDFWKIKEGEIIANKTFKRLLEIIADFNLTTVDIVLSDVYELVDDPEINMKILRRFSAQYINNGGTSLINRTMSFCYFLWLAAQEYKVPATVILQEAIESNLMYKQKSLWMNIKCLFNLTQYPFKIKADQRSMCLITLLNGKPIQDTFRYVAEYNEII